MAAATPLTHRVGFVAKDACSRPDVSPASAARGELSSSEGAADRTEAATAGRPAAFARLPPQTRSSEEEGG